MRSTTTPIRDLTGVDIRPAREFPVDPANTAGFDNSGETLTMSPTFSERILSAAREVSGHMYLKEKGFAFAPHPMLVETDRDKFTVHQIIDFYHQQNIDYIDYFQTAWRFRHRAALGNPTPRLAGLARQYHVSARYLATVWSTLERAEQVGPLVKLQAMWRALPAPRAGQQDVARAGCEEMGSYIAKVRKKVEPLIVHRILCATSQQRRATGITGGKPLRLQRPIAVASSDDRIRTARHSGRCS